MLPPRTALYALLLVTVAGPLAADYEVGLASLMDETAVAVARIDITAEEPAATFAVLAFGGQLNSLSIDWRNVLQELSTGSGVRHVNIILQIPSRVPTRSRRFTFEALGAILSENKETTEQVAKVLRQQAPNRSWQVATRGNYCVFGPKDLVTSALADGHSARPDVEAALAAAEEAPLALVVAPSEDQRRVLTSLLPELPAERGGRLLANWAEQAEWTTVAFEPDRTFRIIMRAESPQSAASLAGEINRFLSGSLANIRAINETPLPFGPLLNALENRVEGNDIVWSVDLSKLPPDDNLFHQVADSALLAINRQQAMQHFREVGIAMQNNHDARKQFPDAAIKSAEGQPLLSWRVQILPFIGEHKLYKEFHLDEPWDSQHNRKLIERMPDVYRLTDNLAPGKTNIVLPIGPDTAFPEGRGRVIREFIDGTSNTILIVEADDEHAVVWTQPADLAYDPADPAAGLGGHFGKGFLTGSADSAVHYLPLDTNSETLRQLFTAAGREAVSWPGQ